MKNIFKVVLIGIYLLSMMMGNGWAKKQIDLISYTSIKPKLTWSPIKNADSYKVIIKELNLDGSTSVKLDVIQTSSYMLDMDTTPTLNLNSIYQVKIKAIGVDAESYKFYLQTITKKITIGGSEFMPDTFDITVSAGINGVSNNSSLFESSALRLTSKATPNADFKTQLYLSHGAQISKFSAVYDDKGNSFNILLRRVSKSDTSASDTIALITTDAVSGINTTVSSNLNSDLATIDNENYIYYILASAVPNGSQLWSVDVEYFGETIN